MLAIKRRVTQRVVIVGLICLLFVTLNIIISHTQRSYNSDDVTWQTTLMSWKPFSPQPAYFGSDPFILKVPVFFILGKLFAPGRGVMLAFDLIFAFINFGCFYYAYLYFVKKLRIPLSTPTLLPVIWLSSLGWRYSALMINPNLRNAELGAMFLLFALGAQIYYGEITTPRSFKTRLLALLGVLLLAGFILNDLYFFYFGVIPLAGLMAYHFFAKPLTGGRSFAVLALLGLGTVLAHIFKLGLRWVGIDFINSGGDSFVVFDKFFVGLQNALASAFLVFNADFWGRPFFKAFTLTTLLGAAVPILVLVVAWRLVKQKSHITNKQAAETAEVRNTWTIFFMSLFAIVILVYAGTDVSVGISTYRYMVVLPLIATMLAGLVIGRLPSVMQHLAVVLFTLAICGNLYASYCIQQEIALGHPQPNSINRDLARELGSRGYTKGYAFYWDGNSSTYFAGGKTHFLPVSCIKGQTVKFFWLVDGNEYTKPAEKSFYVVDPEQFSEMSCQASDISAQFGEPAETIMVSNRTVHLYNYDITSRIP